MIKQIIWEDYEWLMYKSKHVLLYVKTPFNILLIFYYLSKLISSFKILMKHGLMFINLMVDLKFRIFGYY